MSKSKKNLKNTSNYKKLYWLAQTIYSDIGSGFIVKIDEDKLNLTDVYLYLGSEGYSGEEIWIAAKKDLKNCFGIDKDNILFRFNKGDESGFAIIKYLVGAGSWMFNSGKIKELTKKQKLIECIRIMNLAIVLLFLKVLNEKN